MKELKCLIVTITVAMMGVYVYYTHSRRKHFSKLQLENIEALSRDELYDDGIFDQDCDPCITDYGSNGAFFYCAIGMNPVSLQAAW